MGDQNTGENMGMGILDSKDISALRACFPLEILEFFRSSLWVHPMLGIATGPNPTEPTVGTSVHTMPEIGMFKIPPDD